MADRIEIDLVPEVSAATMAKLRKQLEDANPWSKFQGTIRSVAGPAPRGGAIPPGQPGDLVPKVTAQALNALKGQLGGLLAGVLGKAEGALGAAGAAGAAGAVHPALLAATVAAGAKGGKSGGLLPSLGGVLQAVSEAFESLTKHATALVKTVAEFAKIASPAAYAQYEYALKDLHGVIGRMLVPVLQVITPLVKTFADFLLSISPPLEDVRRMMAEFGPMMDQFRGVLGAMAPMLQEIFTTWVRGMTRILQLVNELLDRLGLPKGNLSSATGMGGRPAAFAGVAEYGRQVRLATAQLPAQEGPEIKQLSIQEQILALLQQWLGAQAGQTGARAVIDGALAGARAAGLPGF